MIAGGCIVAASDPMRHMTNVIVGNCSSASRAAIGMIETVGTITAIVV
jgi:hypothetical protein